MSLTSPLSSSASSAIDFTCFFGTIKRCTGAFGFMSLKAKRVSESLTTSASFLSNTILQNIQPVSMVKFHLFSSFKPCLYCSRYILQIDCFLHASVHLAKNNRAVQCFFLP